MTPARSKEPTKKQQSVLEFIKAHLIEKGFPPTVRETAAHFGFASPLSAQLHINALIKKGFLKKTPFKQRSLEIIGLKPAEDTKIPLLGTVRAGAPMLAEENIEYYINIDKDLFRTEDGFALRVIGDSMIDAGILEGDIALIAPGKEARNRDIVVALIENEATIKRFFLDRSTVTLVPENKDMEPMKFSPNDVTIIGRVIGIMRTIR
ncbi:lexA repressor [bacterium BMS3Abin09]|nr:lexA repressor [bacterium BMS3Abin09]GBE41309.1 lexA repressor [bacterium BMS3Bbin09]